MIIDYSIILYIYTLIITLVFLVLKQSSEYRKLYLVLTALPAIFVSSFRYTPNYADYNNYISDFINQKSVKITDVFDYESPVFTLMRILLNKISDDPQIFFVVTSTFIVCVFWWWMHKNSSNIYISILAFQAMGFFSTSINIVRQYFAIGLILIGYDALLNKGGKKSAYFFALIVVLASLVHSSALIAAFAMLVLNIDIMKSRARYTSYILLLIILVGPLISLGNDVFGYHYGNSGPESYGGDGANSLNLVLPILVLVLIYLFGFKVADQKIGKYMVLSTIGCVLSFYAVAQMLILQRLAMYFDVSNLLLVPYFANSIFSKSNYTGKTIYTILIITILYIIYYIFGKINIISSLMF